MLADPEVQTSAPNAAVVLEQATHPYDSFVTPDYNEVTVALGTEIQKALARQDDGRGGDRRGRRPGDGDRQEARLIAPVTGGHAAQR